jgi:hypothetical protein
MCGPVGSKPLAPTPSTPTEFAAFITSETANWRQLISFSGAKTKESQKWVNRDRAVFGASPVLVRKRPNSQ